MPAHSLSILRIRIDTGPVSILFDTHEYRIKWCIHESKGGWIDAFMSPRGGWIDAFMSPKLEYRKDSWVQGGLDRKDSWVQGGLDRYTHESTGCWIDAFMSPRGCWIDAFMSTDTHRIDAFMSPRLIIVSIRYRYNNLAYRYFNRYRYFIWVDVSIL